MAQLPQFTMSELLEAGVHFGHRTHRWNPKLAPYIYGSRNGIHIIDLQQTVPMMYRALGMLRTTVAGGGRVMFVGTKQQAQQPIAEAAERCGMFYVNHRWLGGMLTNWKTIGASIKRLKEFEEQFAASAEAQAKIAELKEEATEDAPADLSTINDPLAHLTKKERLMRQREMEKLQLVLGGIKTMGGLPDVVVVLDVKKDRIAVEEANCLGIPVIGVVDTNASAEGVDFPIPGNDDSSRAISMYCRLFSDAVLAGISEQVVSSDKVEARSTRTKTASGNAKTPKVRLSAKAQEAAEQAEQEAQAADKPAEKPSEPAPAAEPATKEAKEAKEAANS